MGREGACADLVTGLHSSTEDTAKGIKGTAVLLGIQLGNVYKEGTPGVARLDVLNNLRILRAGEQPLNLHGLTTMQPCQRIETRTCFVHNSVPFKPKLGSLCSAEGLLVDNRLTVDVHNWVWEEASGG